MILLDKFTGLLRKAAETVPDPRKGKNIIFSVADIVLSAFAVFQLQCSSWLEFQKKQESAIGHSNLQTLFKCTKIPADNHIRSMLDKIDNNYFNDLFYQILDYLKKTVIFKDLFIIFGKRHSICADGTDYFNSKRLNCPDCSTKYHKKEDSTEYHHTMTGAVICSAKTSEVIALPPFFVFRQESTNDKQDTECKSFKRSLPLMYEKISDLNPILLLDAIYGSQPMIKEINKHTKYNSIISFKIGSQQNIFDYVNGANPNVKKLKYY